jgi:lysophospholipase L1-like esterase
MKSKLLILTALVPLITMSQPKNYDMTKKQPVFSETTGYGYDILPAPKSTKDTKPFYFSVKLDDGNYKVTVILGSKFRIGNTTIRAESRRLFVENAKTAKGTFQTYQFVVNKRSPEINEKESVKIKPREKNKLNWDDKLTLEFNGDAPAVKSISIERDDVCPTIFLCGNSTVVDQDDEPWASWGQMIPRWFNENIAFANYAESGETAGSFLAAGRLKKALSVMKPGDYIFMEFGHNDQKEKGPGKGAYYNFAMNLKIFVDEARSHGAIPIFVTPTQRRSFDDNGKIRETHGDYPSAMIAVAKREEVQLIDLHQMTRVFFETLGIDNSRKALVQYPANTFPGQTKALEDNTHFNPYGAYEVAKCIVMGMKKLNLPILQNIRSDFKDFDPNHPDDFRTFKWNPTPFSDVVKPDGN